jgi:hypothetical protein
MPKGKGTNNLVFPSAPPHISRRWNVWSKKKIYFLSNLSELVVIDVLGKIDFFTRRQFVFVSEGKNGISEPSNYSEWIRGFSRMKQRLYDVIQLIFYRGVKRRKYCVSNLIKNRIGKYGTLFSPSGADPERLRRIPQSFSIGQAIKIKYYYLRIYYATNMHYHVTTKIFTLYKTKLILN